MNKQEWNQIIGDLPQPSLLQTWEWGELKSRYGWDVDHRVWRDESGKPLAAALLLSRVQSIPLVGGSLKILYCPKGPLLDWSNPIRTQVLQDLQQYTQDQRAIYLKMDPELVIAKGFEEAASYEPDLRAANIVRRIEKSGWEISNQQIQFKNTFWIDLNPSEEQLLVNMKQKTRYNIRLAEKKGVQVRQAGLDDMEMIYAMYAETALRDGFIIRPKGYYLDVWRTFMDAGMASPLLAEVDGDTVAGLFLFHFGSRSWYIYGMSRDLHREKMPNYLLQWAAIKRSKQLGCDTYDLWGAPDEFNEADRMWGVYKFKEGLGGKVVQTTGAFDYPASRFKYTIVQNVLPRIQAVTRSMRRKQIQNELSE
jgi:lipid II:glycine glycyltransferase (peptidoglycan interpeptide bridge formation enzyme)